MTRARKSEIKAEIVAAIQHGTAEEFDLAARLCKARHVYRDGECIKRARWMMRRAYQRLHGLPLEPDYTRTPRAAKDASLDSSRL